jgi:large subunit ribosomal protein L24
MLRIRKKDKVQVMSGRDKGKKGEVLKLDMSKERAIVTKINLVTKHKRPTQSETGGREHIEAPLSLAKLMLVCPKCDQPMRPKYDRLQTGEKVRVCRKCGEVIL